MSFKCDKCLNKRTYTTGFDEYPAYTTIEYCGKGHWEYGDSFDKDHPDPWTNCSDFVLKPTIPCQP